jgi:hypothetical protein
MIMTVTKPHVSVGCSSGGDSDATVRGSCLMTVRRRLLRLGLLCERGCQEAQYLMMMMMMLMIFKLHKPQFMVDRLLRGRGTARKGNLLMKIVIRNHSLMISFHYLVDVFLKVISCARSS